MEKTGCKIICDAPTTLAVKGIDDDDELNIISIRAQYLQPSAESSLFLTL